MTRVLCAYLAKARRDGRALLIGIPAVVTVALVIGSFLVPRRFLEDAFFPQVAALACLVLGLLAVAAEVVPGEARRGRMGFLLRLPGGLGTAYAAKVIHVLLSLVLLTAFGFVAGKLVAAAWGVPMSLESSEAWRHFPWRQLWLSGAGPAALVLVAVGGWVLVVSTWLPRGSLALPAAALALGAFGVPLWLLYRAAPGLAPYGGFVVVFTVALVVAPYAIGWLSFVRGRRHGRGAWSSAWRGLVAMTVLFMPAWAFGAFEAHDFLTIDPAGDRARIFNGKVGEGGRYLFLNVGKERLFADETTPPGHPSETGPCFPVLVDLETGRWELAGDAGDRFESRYGERLRPVRLITVRDESASTESSRGLETWRRWLDGATAKVVKSGWDHIDHPELEVYRSERPRGVPEGYTVGGRCGLGWHVYRDGERWLWDPFRGKVFPAKDFEGRIWLKIRPGRWLAFRPRRGTPSGWILLDPETKRESALGTSHRTHVLTLVGDGRALIRIRDADGRTTRVRLVDPETGEGPELELEADHVRSLGRTPSFTARQK